MWESEERSGPHVLTVELAKPAIVTRWRVHNAGNYMARSYDTSDASLEGSDDGVSFFELSEFSNNSKDWVDMAVKCNKPVRFVRLRITKAQQAGSKENRAYVAAFDVFGYSAAK